MLIRPLAATEVAWANARYTEAGFVHSTPADFIAVAELDGTKAGLGRVVPLGPDVGELGGMYVLPEFRGLSLAGRLVDYLIAHGGRGTLFCIPFAHLQPFYARHGFEPVPHPVDIPPAVAAKHRWCQAHYDEPVGLMWRRGGCDIQPIGSVLMPGGLGKSR